MAMNGSEVCSSQHCTTRASITATATTQPTTNHFHANPMGTVSAALFYDQGMDEVSSILCNNNLCDQQSSDDFSKSMNDDSYGEVNNNQENNDNSDSSDSPPSVGGKHLQFCLNPVKLLFILSSSRVKIFIHSRPVDSRVDELKLCVCRNKPVADWLDHQTKVNICSTIARVWNKRKLRCNRN